MVWVFIKFFALGLTGLLALLGLLSLFGGWGLGVALLLTLAWALPRAPR